MSTTMIAARLKNSGVDPEEVAAALFYAHHDYDHFHQCIKDLHKNKNKKHL